MPQSFLHRASNPALRAQAKIAMLRKQNALQPNSAAAATTAKKGAIGKLLLKGGIGVAVLAGAVIGLTAYAHPNRPNTTPDNEFGLHPTAICDIYGEPIMQDFRGVMWNKSTYSRLDPKNLPSLHMCSAQELEDAGYQMDQQGAAGGMPMQKRALVERDAVSFALCIYAAGESRCTDNAFFFID